MSSADLAVFKCLCAVGLGLSSLGGVVAPVYYARKNRNSSTAVGADGTTLTFLPDGRSSSRRSTSSSGSSHVPLILGVANAGSAGLLLGAGLLHFLGESVTGAVSYYQPAATAEVVGNAEEKGSSVHSAPAEAEEMIHQGVQLALLLLIGGVLLPLLVDRVLLAALRGGSIPHGHSHDLHLGDHDNSGGGLENVVDHHGNGGAIVLVPLEGSGTGSSEKSDISRASSSTSSSNTNPHRSNPASSASSKVLLIAILLAIHSFMEGATLGLERTASSLRQALLPMLLHKFFDGLILGVSIAKKEESTGTPPGGPGGGGGGGGGGVLRTIPRSALLWTLVTPLVMMFTAAVSTSSSSSSGSATSLAAVIVQGLGSGSFLYIALVEIIPDEFSPTAASAVYLAGLRGMRARPAFGGNATKWLALVLGSALVILLESDH